MTDVYVIRNQHGHYWGKRKLWQSGEDARTVLRSKHEDEAINILFELSAKDIELRGEVVAAPLSERGEPLIEPSQVPLPSLEEPAMAAEPGAGEAVETSGSTTQETN
ncbi:hypothetical protein [Seongchinamella sediminis]|uniref:hypothetical protein n=1 Tax=Seongchinamella sediminis TaxID=2283635 RepID=UPI001968799A|nr:hypothetical protein [Seongchinamella sediminis]